MPKMHPFLWFDGQAEAAMDFYVSVFPNSKVLDVQRFPEGGPGAPGSVMICSFELDGFKITALNGGPHFKFSEAVSFMIDTADQAETDYYWDRLGEGGGGTWNACGWLKDRFGFSWQVTPRRLMELLGGPDAEGRNRAYGAMMQMTRIDIAVLEAAYKG